MRPFPVIDLFAGPGGLGEGFSSFRDQDGATPFRIGLSIEKDAEAHATLTLRAFFRQFADDEVPPDYYQHLRGEIARDELFARFPSHAAAAAREAWQCELGKVSERELDRRVSESVAGADPWVLIGGPPCQAYSIVGRSRMRGDPAKFARDPRHFLYREYLRIVALHRPPVFVMENVKGLLSATHGGERMFDRILEDLRHPGRALKLQGSIKLRYRLHALSPAGQNTLFRFTPAPENFVVKAEDFGIPQARHRIIILGVRDDVDIVPERLTPGRKQVPVSDVICDLPRLRSRLSKTDDSYDHWRQTIAECSRRLEISEFPTLVRYLNDLNPEAYVSSTGGEFVPVRRSVTPRYRSDWYSDKRLRGVCNHASRSHVPGDIQRYFFAAAFAASMNGNARSPQLADFPAFLLPNHQNIDEAIAGNMFGDRFRVQIAGRPSTTVTSHISKDGHYYIHPDPAQARSLTVREAARLQTFPDNYYFCGPRTSQYHQVGNAVPPLLANQIADIVYRLFNT